MFQSQIVETQASLYDSFYLYDGANIQTAMDGLQHHFPSAQFLYSLKTNPNPNVVAHILSHGFGVDAASVAEVQMGVAHGVPKEKIQYSAPGKTTKNIEDTIHCATIIADSFQELLRINQVAGACDMVAEIGVRLNPNFTFTDNQGVPSKFGIDEAAFFASLPHIQSLSHLRIVGLHVHVRSQELSESTIANYHAHVMRLAHHLQEFLATPLTFLNLGSGIGIPYEAHDAPIDLALLGSKSSDVFNAFSTHFPNTKLYIETGRYVVGKSGVYVTHVLDKKVSHGKTYIILSNTLNGFIRPSLAQLVCQYATAQQPAANEPLFTTKQPSQMLPLHPAPMTETVTLVGNLCTATDVVATDVTFPKLEVDDVVIFTNAGSYAAVLSPMQFSSQTPPKELFVNLDGTVSQ